MSKKFYITTPIYYVNDKPHIGHAYTTVAADVLARYHRSTGKTVYFLTGTDEHGQKVEKAAQARGMEPQAHCDELSVRFRDLWKLLDIEPSAFIRTTDHEHKKLVAEQLSLLHQKGLIERRDFEGWYCTRCERFWTEKDLNDKHCPDCRDKVEMLAESAYFFLMSRYRDRIRDEITSDRMKIRPETRRNEVLGFLENELEDLCISRPRKRMGWGISLPFDPDYVTYVWFDALLNYVSGARYLAKNPPTQGWWPADLHLIGKDILTTHAVYWPAMLMALELELPKSIVAHGWWKFSGEKMSKSQGNVVDPVKLVADYGGPGGVNRRAAVDSFRYFLLAEASFGNDGNFSLEAFEKRWTADLSNDLGNLLSRVSSLITKVLGGRVESVSAPEDAELVAKYREFMEEAAFQKALDLLLTSIRAMNVSIQTEAPWSNRDAAPKVLGRAAAVLRLAAILLDPFIPASSRMIANALGMNEVPTLDSADKNYIAQPVKAEPLFPRPALEIKIETEKKMTEEKQPAAGSLPPSAESTGKAQITMDEFAKVDLRVARVLEAKKVEGTEKLLELKIDAGDGVRTLVAGIAKQYEPEALIGKSVVIVANLKPAKLRGILSQGMILAASSTDGSIGPIVVVPEGPIPPGSTVR